MDDYNARHQGKRRARQKRYYQKRRQAWCTYYQRYAADRRAALCEQLHTWFSRNPARAARVIDRLIAKQPGTVAKYALVDRRK